VEWGYEESFGVPLRLRENILRPERKLFRLDNAQDLAVYAKSVVRRPCLRRVLLNRTPVKRAKAFPGVKPHNLPPGILQAAVNNLFAGDKFGVRRRGFEHSFK